MLSRKRYRGTLQDYNKEEISKCQSKLWTNRNVFSWCLNGTTEETVWRDGGRLFHALKTNWFTKCHKVITSGVTFLSKDGRKPETISGTQRGMAQARPTY